MKHNKSLSAWLKLRHSSTLASYMTAPFLGLGYIIAFPFLGLVSAILLLGYCVKQRIVTVGHRAV